MGRPCDYEFLIRLTIESSRLENTKEAYKIISPIRVFWQQFSLHGNDNDRFQTTSNIRVNVIRDELRFTWGDRK